MFKDLKSAPPPPTPFMRLKLNMPPRGLIDLYGHSAVIYCTVL